MRFALLAFAATVVYAQPDRIVSYNDIAISPDGKYTAWVQGVGGERGASLYIAPADGSAKPAIVPMAQGGLRTDFEPAWSPDGKTLAFLSKGSTPGSINPYTTSPTDGATQLITELKGFAERPRWSHDGTRIALLYIEGAVNAGPLSAAPAMTGVIDELIHNQRIAIVDMKSHALKYASPENLHIYDFDWSPDDARFAVTAGASIRWLSAFMADPHPFCRPTGRRPKAEQPNCLQERAFTSSFLIREEAMGRARSSPRAIEKTLATAICAMC